MHLHRLTAALGAAALVLTLGACGDDVPDAATSTTDDATTMTTDIEAATLTMTDPWVKAAPHGMTAAFGTLVNSGEDDITLVAATSTVAGSMELHETVMADDGAMAMQPKEGGFVIPAGGEHELAPGGDHLMIMDLTRPLRPGESIILLLEMSDGSTTEVDATVKRFTGAEEKYQAGSGHDMGSDDEDDAGHDMGDS